MVRWVKTETHVILTESQVDKLLIQSIDKYIQVSSVTELTDNRSIVSYLSILNQDESVKNVQCLLLRRQRLKVELQCLSISKIYCQININCIIWTRYCK